MFSHKKDICEINQVVLNFCRNVYRLDIFSKLQPEQTTGMVDEQPLPGRPCKTKPRGQARRNCFATSARIRDELNIGVGVCICKDC
jgi:hypothetical protein